MRPHSSSPPPSSELRLSEEARHLGEESAGCICSQGKRVTCFLFLRGREGKGEAKEGRGHLAGTQLIRSSGRQETLTGLAFGSVGVGDSSVSGRVYSSPRKDLQLQGPCFPLCCFFPTEFPKSH